MKPIRKIIKWKRRIAAITSAAATISALYGAYTHYSNSEWIKKLFNSFQSEKAGAVDYPAINTVSMDDISSGLLVEFIDVGQGDSILVYDKSSDAAMLVDTGKYNAYDNVQTALAENGIDSLDYFAVTHMDADHMQSASDILEDYDVDTLLCANNLDKDTQCVSDLKNSCATNVDNIVFPAAGDSFKLGNANITVMGPVENIAGSHDNSNEYSLIIRVTYGDVNYLLTGDADETEYLEAKANGMDFSDIDVVKLMHHGSAQDGANSVEFLRDTDLQYAVISCGYENEYGHPHREVVQALSDMGINTFRTDLQGSIISATDGSSIAWNIEPTTNFKCGEEISNQF